MKFTIIRETNNKSHSPIAEVEIEAENPKELEEKCNALGWPCYGIYRNGLWMGSIRNGVQVTTCD